MCRKLLLVGLFWLLGAHASYSLGVTKVGDFSCPDFLTETTVTGGAPYEFEFAWSLAISTISTPYYFEEGPDCCSDSADGQFALPLGVGMAVINRHYVTPSGHVPNSIWEGLVQECEDYTQSHSIWRDWCEPDVIKSGYCAASLTQSAAEAAIRPTVYGPERLTELAVIDQSQTSSAPLLVTADVIGTREATIALLAEGRQDALAQPLTNLASVMRDSGCIPVAGSSRKSGEKSGFARTAFDCPTGFVFGQEIFNRGLRQGATSSSSKSIPLAGGRNASAQYFISEQGDRRSMLIWSEGSTMVVVSLLHRDDDQAGWLREIADKVKVTP